jgi:hypothetical protein
MITTARTADRLATTQAGAPALEGLEDLLSPQLGGGLGRIVLDLEAHPTRREPCRKHFRKRTTF